MTAARFLGTSDDVTTCECCGRSNLKSTVALLMGDSTTPVYFGVSCAARALRTSSVEVRKGAREVERAHADALAYERHLAERAEDVRWQGFLDASAGAGERIDQIARLGGFAVARALYAAEVAR